MMIAPQPDPARSLAFRTDLGSALSDLFDAGVAAYYVALVGEEWSAAFALADLIAEIHRLEARVAT